MVPILQNIAPTTSSVPFCLEAVRKFRKHVRNRKRFTSRAFEGALLPSPRVRYNFGMNAICLVFDRLHAGYVGAYGNSWIETPSFDRLASQAFLFDRALIDSPELARLYRSYWQGWHALCPAAPESRPSLAAQLGEAGVTTVLLTDEPQVARHPLAADFDELIEIDPPWQPQVAAAVEQTHFGRCFARDHRLAGIGPGAVSVVVSLGRLGHDVGRAAQVPPGVLRGRRSAAARNGRRTRSDVARRLRPRRTARHRAVVFRPGDAVGHVPRRVFGFLLRIAHQQRDAVDGHVGPRFSAGRTWPGGAVRRRAVRRDGPRSLADAISRRRRRRRAEPSAGRAGRPLGKPVGLVGRRRRATFAHRRERPAAGAAGGRRRRGQSHFADAKIGDSPPRSALHGGRPRSAGDPHAGLVSPRPASIPNCMPSRTTAGRSTTSRLAARKWSNVCKTP